MGNVKTDSGAEFLIAMAEAQGIAVSSVSDGHIFVITRKHIMSMLDKMNESGSETTIVFVKRQEPGNN